MQYRVLLLQRDQKHNAELWFLIKLRKILEFRSLLLFCSVMWKIVRTRIILVNNWANFDHDSLKMENKIHGQYFTWQYQENKFCIMSPKSSWMMCALQNQFGYPAAELQGHFTLDILFSLPIFFISFCLLFCLLKFVFTHTLCCMARGKRIFKKM